MIWSVLLTLLAQSAQAGLPSLSRPILCDGSYSKKSSNCTLSLEFQGCTQAVRMHWQPVRLPKPMGVVRAERSWCDVTWESNLRVVQKKIDPRVCLKIVDQFAVSLRRFKDLGVGTGQCQPGNLETQARVSQTMPSQDATAASTHRAVQIEGASHCALAFDSTAKVKPWVLRCDVLPLASFRWLKTTLDLFDARIELHNPLK